MTTFQGVPLDTAISATSSTRTFMFTSLGVPMLWEGMEFSAPRGWLNERREALLPSGGMESSTRRRGDSPTTLLPGAHPPAAANPALFAGPLVKLADTGREKVARLGVRGLRFRVPSSWPWRTSRSSPRTYAMSPGWDRATGTTSGTRPRSTVSGGTVRAADAPRVHSALLLEHSRQHPARRARWTPGEVSPGRSRWIRTTRIRSIRYDSRSAYRVPGQGLGVCEADGL